MPCAACCSVSAAWRRIKRAAANAGARVILCDEQCELGGSLLSDPAVGIEGKNSSEWLKSTLARRENAQVSLLPRTTAFGYFRTISSA
jgi:sarcosine oxidase subunit alpha